MDSPGARQTRNTYADPSTHEPAFRQYFVFRQFQFHILFLQGLHFLGELLQQGLLVHFLTAFAVLVLLLLHLLCLLLQLLLLQLLLLDLRLPLHLRLLHLLHPHLLHLLHLLLHLLLLHPL